MKISSFNIFDYQCFGTEGAGISDIKRLNILIGPNNAGKSKILKSFSMLMQQTDNILIPTDKGPRYRVGCDVTELARDFFPEGNFGGGMPGPDFWNGFGRHLNAILVEIEINKNSLSFDHIEFEADRYYSYEVFENAKSQMSSRPEIVRQSIKFSELKYISAERDIVPESADTSISIRPNGNGVTNAIRKIINTHDIDSNIVERDVLNDINVMANPEFQYDRVLVQELDGGKWEVFLDERRHGRVPLSECGSGVKTIIFIALVFNLNDPGENSEAYSKLVLLEELENSLHPRTQRKVLAYVSSKISEYDVCVIATHSPVCLDYFQGVDDVSFTSITQYEGSTHSTPIAAFVDRTGVLDALGVKASEVLHSNCVIWVEGPTDRIYLKRFIEIFSDGKLVEGHHFSIMFYGGKLLSHLTVDEPEMISELISLININKNAAILIDSDRTSKGARIRDTKRRIYQEARRTNALVWVTQGREIENYIRDDFWTSNVNVRKQDVGPYSKIFEAVQGKEASGKRISTKMELAKWASNRVATADFALDLERQMKNLIGFVEQANGMRD